MPNNTVAVRSLAACGLPTAAATAPTLAASASAPTLAASASAPPTLAAAASAPPTLTAAARKDEDSAAARLMRHPAWESARAHAERYASGFRGARPKVESDLRAEVAAAVRFLQTSGFPTGDASPETLVRTTAQIKRACVLALSGTSGPDVDQDRYAASLEYNSPAYDAVALLSAVTGTDPADCAPLVRLYFGVRDAAAPPPPPLDLGGKRWDLLADYSEEFDDEAVVWLLDRFATNGTVVVHVVAPFDARMRRLEEVTGVGRAGIRRPGLTVEFRPAGDAGPADARILLVQAPVPDEAWLAAVDRRAWVVVTGELVGGSVNLNRLGDRRAPALARFEAPPVAVPAHVTRGIPFPKPMADPRLEAHADALCRRFAANDIPSAVPLETGVRVNHANARDQFARFRAKKKSAGANKRVTAA